jgi:hypothetical protein
MSRKDSSTKLKRESSILSYFQKVSPDKNHSGFVSAKSVSSQPQTTSVNPSIPKPPAKSNPFGISGFSSKAISNDSKYINPDLYGDKLVFSSQITAKRTVAAEPKDYNIIDLTGSADSPSSPRPTIANNSSGYQNFNSQPKAGSPSVPQNANRSTTPSGRGMSAGDWKASGSSARNPLKQANSQAHVQKPWKDHAGYQALPAPPGPSISSSAQPQRSPMFGNPVLSKDTRKEKRTLPSNTFSEFKRNRVESFRQEKPYELTPIGDYKLSAEQTAILNMAIFERKSLFFTGSAGTGKSILLRG